jgi:hypothetical protein
MEKLATKALILQWGRLAKGTYLTTTLRIIPMEDKS